MGTKRYAKRKPLEDLLETKTEDIIYMAGFFDGEGCISIVRDKRTQGRSHLLSVSTCNTDRKIIEWIVENFGGHVNAHSSPKRSQHRKTWGWQLRSEAAMEFLIVIGGHLKIKNRQAKLGIQFQMEKARFSGGMLSENEIELRELYRQQMSALNAGD